MLVFYVNNCLGSLLSTSKFRREEFRFKRIGTLLMLAISFAVDIHISHVWPLQIKALVMASYCHEYIVVESERTSLDSTERSRRSKSSVLMTSYWSSLAVDAIVVKHV